MQQELDSHNSTTSVTGITEPSEGNNKLGALVTGGLLLVFIGALVMAYQLGIGTLTRPGPGLWPFFVSIIGAALSVATLIKGSAWRPSPIGTYRWTHVMMALVITYAILLPILGYIPATVFLCLGITKIIGSMGWASSVTTSIMTPLASYFVSTLR